MAQFRCKSRRFPEGERGRVWGQRSGQRTVFRAAQQLFSLNSEILLMPMKGGGQKLTFSQKNQNKITPKSSFFWPV
jgi:hypothetical protein